MEKIRQISRKKTRREASQSTIRLLVGLMFIVFLVSFTSAWGGNYTKLEYQYTANTNYDTKVHDYLTSIFTLGFNSTTGLDYDIRGINISIGKGGSPGLMDIQLWNVSAGEPDALIPGLNVSIDATAYFTTDYLWYEFNMSGVRLVNGTQYALVFLGYGDDISNYIDFNQSSNAYGGGEFCYGDDLSTWTCSNGAIKFEVWGGDAVPGVSISYPLTSTAYVNVSGYLNYTVVGSVDRCWYSKDYGSTNSSTVVGGTNFPGLSASAGFNTWTVYCNSSIGVGNSTTTFVKGFTENSRTYNPTSLVTTSEQFKINITTDGTQTPIVYLIYGGVSKLTTLSNGEYVVNISVNTLGSNTFLWNVLYGSINFTTTSSTQVVTGLTSMEIVNGACTTGLSKVMNFSFANEMNLTTLENVTIRYNFKYGISNTTGAVTYGDLTATELSVCLNTTESSYYNIGYGEVEYELNGYTARRYYVFDGTRVTNVTTENTLYLLPDADSTSFLIEVQDSTQVPYVGRYTTLLRWYPSLNEYIVVEMGKTDDKGQTVKKVKVEDADYRIGIYETDGTLIYLASPIRMVCLTSPCSYTLTVKSESTYTFDEVLKIQADISYADGIFTLTYNDPSQNTENMELRVYQIGGSASDNQICSSNGTSFTGILTCDVSAYSGTLKAVAYRSASPTYPVSTLIVDTLTTVFQGTFGLFIQFIISVVLVFAGIISPVVGIILGVLSLAVGLFLFHTITYPVFIGIAILGGLVVHFMRRSAT